MGRCAASGKGGDDASEIGGEFYRGEYVLVVGAGLGPPGSYRATFVRDAGRVAWLSFGGRLYERQRCQA